MPMKHTPVILVDRQLAKQRRAHAVTLDHWKTYQWHTDLVACLALCFDAGHRRVIIESEAGVATVKLERLDPPRIDA